MNADLGAGGPAPFSAERFANGWVLLRHVPLGEAVLDIVLIQPTAGVALLEIEPRWTPDALDALRARLQESGFLAAYPGHLPMIHRRLEPTHVDQLGEILSEAFIWQPPLTLFGPGPWHEALERVLSPGFGAEPIAPPADATTVLAAAASILAEARAEERAAPAPPAEAASATPEAPTAEWAPAPEASPAWPDAVPAVAPEPASTPAWEPEPVRDAEPVVATEPEPVADAGPAVWAEPQPLAEAAPVAEPEPVVAVEPAPEPAPLPPPDETRLAAPAAEAPPAPPPAAPVPLPNRLPPPRPIPPPAPEPVILGPAAPQPRQPAAVPPPASAAPRAKGGLNLGTAVVAAIALAALGAGLLYLERLHRTGVERPVTNFLSPPDPPASAGPR
jgi:hypothetical protein